jgi:glycosyltransferase involved in cell wall biosynthesis
MVLKKFYDPPIGSWPRIYFASRRVGETDCVFYIDSFAGTAVGALAKLHGKKLVFRPNDCLFSLGLQVFHSYSRVKGMLMLVYACVFERLASKMADVILASSGEEASTLERLYGTRGKTFVIPPGSECEPGKEYSSVRPKHGFGENQPVILFLGTGDHFPNRLAIQFIEDILAPFIEREVPEARIMIVGRNTEEFRNRIRTKNVLVVGEVPETGPYLASADLGIAPMTIVGGVNAKVIEYLCGGLPTVATGVSVKAFGQARGLFASDIDHFCETVSAVIKDVDRLKSLRKETREQALRDYSWESIGSQVTLILNSLLRRTNEY